MKLSARMVTTTVATPPNQPYCQGQINPRNHHSEQQHREGLYRADHDRTERFAEHDGLRVVGRCQHRTQQTALAVAVESCA